MLVIVNQSDSLIPEIVYVITYVICAVIGLWPTVISTKVRRKNLCTQDRTLIIRKFEWSKMSF